MTKIKSKTFLNQAKVKRNEQIRQNPKKNKILRQNFKKESGNISLLRIKGKTSLNETHIKKMNKSGNKMKVIKYQAKSKKELKIRQNKKRNKNQAK